jgi:mycothiol synthase
MRIEQVAQLDRSQADEVVALRDRVTGSEGSSPLSDEVVVGLRTPRAGVRHLLAWDGPQLAGYGQLDSDGSAEVVVAPQADPAPLLDELTGLAGSGLSIWARGQQSPLATELPRRGFVVARELVQMRRDMALALDAPVWPAGVSVRTFVVDADEAAWLDVNNRAFADHPDQSGWTIEDITAREREPWFDPAGFFLAERAGELVGFHWTKVHSGTGRPAIGEVYVIGVAPEMQGQRLGDALARHGLAHLRDAGITSVMLYVEATNHGAIGLYERLGFAEWDRDRRFILP